MFLTVMALVEEQIDSVAELDVLELLNLQLAQVEAVFLVLLDDGRELRVIDGDRQPELRYPLNNLVAFVSERPTKFVVLLIYL